MATLEDNKLRTLAGVVGIGSIALFGATACDDNGDDPDDADNGVENGDDLDNGLDDDGDDLDDGLDDDDDDDAAE